VRGITSICTLAILLLAHRTIAQDVKHADDKHPRLEFTRMVAHWAEYGDADYLAFISGAQPELAQIGFYGGHFWSLAHTPQYGGYPAHFPVQGLAECGDWFAKTNAQLHQRDVRVIGHFNVEFLVGEPNSDEGPRGFFKFYRDLWDEKQLGPKPVADPLDLMEKDADGKPITQQGYSIGGMHEYWACLRNKHWQKVLKAWVKVGIERGVDGFIINYFYRHNCLCEHCQAGFRSHLSERFTAAELKEKFGIDILADHRFSEIVSWHDPKDSSPLRREMLSWSQISNKQVFDEVFVRYGRTLKPDLIVAQWNHLGNFSQIAGDERSLLPAEYWGKDEDYLWYSTGDAAHYTDLKNRYLGEATLQARYIRGAFDDKPFTIGKYESTRIRVAIAELAANGGAPMGFYTRFKDPAARETIVRYYQFLKRHDELFHGNRSHAEAVLLFPRRAVHSGNLQPLEKFRQMGQRLLDAHVLFDVLPDDLPEFLQNEARLQKYAHVLSTDKENNFPAADAPQFSRFEAPFTVRISASRPVNSDDIVIHFVNYNRDEPPPGADGKPSSGSGIVDEKPIAVESITADVVLPAHAELLSVELLSPEYAEPKLLTFKQTGQRVVFDVPEFLVYAVARLKIRVTDK